MSILVDELPCKVSINGREYKINADFRTSIKFETFILNDPGKDDQEIFIETLKLYYPEFKSMPVEDYLEATNKIIWFYKCGKDEEEKEGSKKGGNDVIYSYEHDDALFYSAFMDQYKIDLQEVKFLHWWKFKGLQNGLKEDNEIVKIMRIRATDLNFIKGKEEKAYYRKMKKIYALPRNKKEVEENNKLIEALLNGDDLTGIL